MTQKQKKAAPKVDAFVGSVLDWGFALMIAAFVLYLVVALIVVLVEDVLR